jgi:hypothetical protein
MISNSTVIGNNLTCTYISDIRLLEETGPSRGSAVPRCCPRHIHLYTKVIIVVGGGGNKDR